VEKIRSAEYVRSAHSARDLLQDERPQVAFVGRSNVGKSSLLNALLGKRALARTSSTPGRTQAVNYFLVNERLFFVDLPGYGYAKASKDKRRAWAQTLESYFESALPEALVVLLIDAKVGGTDLDAQASEYMTSLGAEPLVVATKIDKVPRSQRHRALAQVRDNVVLPAGYPVRAISAETGEGVRELWADILARLGPA